LSSDCCLQTKSESGFDDDDAIEFANDCESSFDVDVVGELDRVVALLVQQLLEVLFESLGELLAADVEVVVFEFQVEVALVWPLVEL